MSTWVSVDDKLPANRAIVLVWNTSCGFATAAEFQAFSATRYGFYAMDGDSIDPHEITHWRPMVEPPEDIDEVPRG